MLVSLERIEYILLVLWGIYTNYSNTTALSARMITMAVDFTPATIAIEKLRLDIENPRLLEHVVTGNAPENQEQLEASISGDGQFTSLLRSIKKSGVNNSIWVTRLPDGYFLVREGNRRITCLRKLVRENVAPPEGVSYETVPANILNENATELEIKVLCGSLQTGKAEWGAFQYAAYVADLHNKEHMPLEDIAIELQDSIGSVKKALNSYKIFIEYSRHTGDVNTKRFSMFNQAPKKVTEWIADSPKNKSDYFDWINPTNGAAKIRSAATKGGLRDFAKVIDDHEALELLREDPMANVEDALEVVKQNDIKKDMPFLARLLPFGAHLRDLTDAQKARIASEPRIRVHLKSLKSACEALINELEEFDS